MGIISFLILGFILSLFGMDYHLPKALSEMTGKKFSESIYWAFWFILGMIYDVSQYTFSILS